MLKVKFNKEEYGHKNKYELISYIRYCRELLGMYQSTFLKNCKVRYIGIFKTNFKVR